MSREALGVCNALCYRLYLLENGEEDAEALGCHIPAQLEVRMTRNTGTSEAQVGFGLVNEGVLDLT